MKNSKRENPKNVQPSQAEIKNLIELFHNGLYNDAEKIAQSITKEFPKYQFAWKVLGVIFTKTNRVNDALVVTKKAVKLFKAKKKLRIIDSTNMKLFDKKKIISGINSFLFQTNDEDLIKKSNFKIVSKKKPSKNLMNELIFSFNVCISL